MDARFTGQNPIVAAATRLRERRRLEEAADFILRVNVWLRSPGTEPQQTDGRDFGFRISTNTVTRKTTYDDEPT